MAGSISIQRLENGAGAGVDHAAPWRWATTRRRSAPRPRVNTTVLPSGVKAGEASRASVHGPAAGGDATVAATRADAAVMALPRIRARIGNRLWLSIGVLRDR